jgi:AcrR family transcriptional regulator
VRGGRVDAIARAAKANKQLIYYYFGSKAALFSEVLRRHLADDVPSTPSESTVTRRLLLQDDVYARDTDYLRLLMWESLEGVPEAAGIRREGVNDYLARIRADRAAGLLGEVDPGQLLLAEIGIAVLPYLFPQLAEIATGRPANDREARRARVRFLTWLGGRLDECPVSGRSSGDAPRTSQRSPRRPSP